MNTDIRLLVSFKNHRKRKRLKMLLGPGSTDYLIDIWLTAAEDRPDGILTSWDELDIAIAAGWEEDPAALVDALVKTKWIDKDSDGTYLLHDWEEHQGWACGAKARSSAAKKAANIRWAKRLGQPETCEPDSDSNASALRPHQERIAPSPIPSPKPSPSLKPCASGDAPLKPEIFYETKKKKKLSGKRLESFEQFWSAFSYKKGRAEAADVWLEIPGLKPSIVDKIIKAAKLEASSRNGQKTPKMAQGWLSGRRWEDEHTEAPVADKFDIINPKLFTGNVEEELYK